MSSTSTVDLKKALAEGRLPAVPSLRWVRKHFGETVYRIVRTEQKRRKADVLAARDARKAAELNAEKREATA